MATDRRILRIDKESEAQTRIAAAVTTGVIVAAEGNLLWCRDTNALYYIGTLAGGAYPLTAINDSASASLLKPVLAEVFATSAAAYILGDSGGRPALLVNTDGTVALAGATEQAVESDLYAVVYADPGGYIGAATTLDGQQATSGRPAPQVLAWADDQGQVWASYNGQARQITTTAGNSGVQVQGDRVLWMRGGRLFQALAESGPGVPAQAQWADRQGGEANCRHIIRTGQSLSVGETSYPPITTEQHYLNHMLADGLRSLGQTNGQPAPDLALAYEQDSPDSQSGQGFFNAHGGETGMLSAANLMSRYVERLGVPQVNSILLLSVAGRGGADYNHIKQGTDVYNNGLQQVRNALAATRTARGWHYEVAALDLIHGESDYVTPEYADLMLKLHDDWNADVLAITGQPYRFPIFACQPSSWTKLNNSFTAYSPFAMLDAAARRPEEVFIVGPKYHLSYSPDGVHLTNRASAINGEYHGKAWRRVLVDGLPWVPLSPRRVTVSGNTVRARFFVPAPPLVLDTTLVTDPGQLGFEIVDDDGGHAITGIVVSSPDTLTLTFSGALGANPKLRYAFGGVAGNAAGPTTGPRGNLRDSDPTASAYQANALYNWCVHFVTPITGGY